MGKYSPLRKLFQLHPGKKSCSYVVNGIKGKLLLIKVKGWFTFPDQHLIFQPLSVIMGCPGVSVVLFIVFGKLITKLQSDNIVRAFLIVFFLSSAVDHIIWWCNHCCQIINFFWIIPDSSERYYSRHFSPSLYVILLYYFYFT